MLTLTNNMKKKHGRKNQTTKELLLGPNGIRLCSVNNFNVVKALITALL